MEEVCLLFQLQNWVQLAIKGAIEKSGLSVNDIQEVFMGNVLQANLGQTSKTSSYFCRTYQRMFLVQQSIKCVHQV